MEVKESSNKPPMFRQGPGAVIELSEGFVDYGNPIATYAADSQIKGDPLVYFELVNGRTEQAATLTAVPDPENQNEVIIYLVYVERQDVMELGQLLTSHKTAPPATA